MTACTRRLARHVRFNHNALARRHDAMPWAQCPTNNLFNWEFGRDAPPTVD